VNGVPQTSSEAPLVDIILPAYNGSAVIRKAIKGAFAQDVPFRLIVVDDGSKDDSGEIARTYGPRVTVLRQANRGVSGARNAGLAIATAPYIALLDQDDVWLDGKLARQLKLITNHPEVGIVFTDMTRVMADGSVVEDGFLRTTAPYATLERELIGDEAYMLHKDVAQAVVRFNFISPSTVLLRRAAVQEVGGFDETLRLCDDAECWMRLLTRWRAIAIERSLIRALVWEGNASLMGDKLIRERIRIGEKATAHPELYAPGTVEYLRRERPVSYYRLGVLALRAGEARRAREHFSASFRDKRSLSAALGIALGVLPAPVRDRLLRMKRLAGIRWAIEVK
jgi:glycosyltransferase involved in cell wall biosynthesis